MKKLKITGFVEMFLTDKKTGIKKKIYEGSNTISNTLYWAVAKYLRSTSDDIALNSLFTANSIPPTNHKDGIVFLEQDYIDPVLGQTKVYQSMKTTITQPATNQFRATGLYDAGVAVDILELELGKSWVTTFDGQGGSFVDMEVATHSPSSLSIPISTDYTVIWTLTFTVH